ncbi:MAG: hypothetical protein M1837_000809 [Sclerophora amabilis]|nr:MAG: hypothetical protein M1837_000809 [Sclerophora amabilis]
MADHYADLIWGDDSESQVFAEARADNLSVTFKFLLDGRVPQSRPSRIVACFHGLPAKAANETFPSRRLMREAIDVLIRGVWIQCTGHPSIAAPDVLVQIFENTEGHVQWRACRESSYTQFAESLLPVGSLSDEEELKSRTDYSSLIQLRQLGGRGNATAVRRSSSSEGLFVFKGVDFKTFLEAPADFRHRKEMCYHEIRTIASLPRHPNIVPPPEAFVTVRRVDDDQGEEFLCGMLVPLLGDGTLDDEINKSNAAGARLELKEKAAWSFQMACAVAHTHLVAHTFHMDIKPSNFVVDTNRALILVDWEQSGAALYTLAPEADGTWDVVEEGAPSIDQPPVYKKYGGPPRENLSWGRPKWNVFPIWRNVSPRALEAAEVFSLGRTMWMMLQQVSQSEVEDVEEVVTCWNESSGDIPETWKAVVNRCVHPDPNRRIRLWDLVTFWDMEQRSTVHGSA